MSLQAVILVGGKGTRLQPLTAERPKPIVSLVDRPFMAYMLEWVASHGITDVIMCCGFLPDALQEVLGDGSRYGVELTWVIEPDPRGTAGALKMAEQHITGRFVMLNGDVLTDIDLSAQLRQHESTGATGTLGLVPVDDPTAYGLVRLGDDLRVTGFLEKPEPSEIDTDLISAGVYVLEPRVLGMIPPDRMVSIEREVWPLLVDDGLYGCRHGSAYWMDIGTPERYLEGTADILAGRVRTRVAERLAAGAVDPSATVASDLDVSPEALVDAGARIGTGVRIGAGSVIGRNVTIADDVTIENAVILEGAQIASGVRLDRCVVGQGAEIGANVRVAGAAMVGDGAVIGAGNTLDHGMRVMPRAEISADAIRF
ncbi:MAG: NDP-sugar synthase [Patulibacter sp.]|nr:NDP-sugar synthase [Patulibacter sp.]